MEWRAGREKIKLGPIYSILESPLSKSRERAQRGCAAARHAGLLSAVSTVLLTAKRVERLVSASLDYMYKKELRKCVETLIACFAVYVRASSYLSHAGWLPGQKLLDGF
jgi:hypothetical protein